MTTMREELDKLFRTMECYDYDADEYKGRHAVHSFAAMLATVLMKHDAHLANGAQEWQPIETAPNDGAMHVRGLHVFSSTDGRFLYWDAVVGHIDTEDGLFYDQGGDVCGWDADDFTHWHPLAAAPQAGERE